jgi:hypothetical protein
MARSSSSEPSKSNGSSNGGSKRKGTRSVSTLTPSQLARKRANDREAQRAIRARTKEHIERLEKELEDLRSQQSRDQTVQELMRRNKALEDELHRLKETMGVSGIVNGAAGGPPPTTSPYSSTPGTASSAATSAATSSMEIDTFGVLEGAVPSLTSSPFTVYDDAGPSPTRGSPFPAPGYDGSLPDYGASAFVPLPDNANNADGSNWPPVPNAIPSTVSSPSSSADDYTTAGSAPYMPTSMPNGMIPSGGNGVVKMEFDDGDRDIGFPQHLNNDLLQLQLQHQHHQAAMLAHSNNSSNTSSPDQPPRSIPWAAPPNMFPMFYPQQQSPVH